MQDFEVEMKVLGEFPKYLKPQITDKIKIVKEKLNDDESLSETTLLISVNSESDLNAEYHARKFLSQFLSFYSVTTLNHIRILDDYNEPIKIRNITENEESSSYYPTAYSLEEYDDQFFLNKILPCYPTIIKKGNEYLKIASEYLWRGRFEESVEICIIDCFIALEALFMRTNDNTELSYRLSNRIAVLLSEHSEERLELRRKFYDLYKLRSKIVHGVPTELNFDDCKNIFSLTRDAILRFLVLAEKYPNHDKIVDLLDDAMIDNQILKTLNDESNTLIEAIDEAHKANLSKFLNS